MSSLYSQFQTDKNVEKEGVVLTYGMNSKNKPIEIRIARAGGANVRYNKLLEAATKPYRRQLQNETMDNELAEQITQKVYAQSILLGWENVEDENGVELSFNVDNCMKLFKDLPDLWSDIQIQSTRAALFRAQILETDSKN